MRIPSHLAPLLVVPIAAVTSCGSSNHSQTFTGDDGGGGGDATMSGGEGGTDGSDDSSAASEGGSDSGGDGSVVCTGGKMACGGVCIDPTSNASNCGACGVKCTGTGAACCASMCVTGTASCSFSVTSVSPLTGAVNGGDYVTLTGKGFVAGMQVLIDGAPAPTLVKSATAALAQTPPDVMGAKDITIRSGTSTATLPKGFVGTEVNVSATGS
jgi:hypothetical protein